MVKIVEWEMAGNEVIFQQHCITMENAKLKDVCELMICDTEKHTSAPSLTSLFRVSSLL